MSYDNFLNRSLEDFHPICPHAHVYFLYPSIQFCSQLFKGFFWTTSIPYTTDKNMATNTEFAGDLAHFLDVLHRYNTSCRNKQGVLKHIL